MTVTVEGVGQEVAGEQREELEVFLLSAFVHLHLYECVCPRACVCVCTHSVDRECSVSKAPGFMEVIWLSYSDRRRTELNPTKLLLLTQLIRLLLSILLTHTHAQIIKCIKCTVYFKGKESIKIDR